MRCTRSHERGPYAVPKGTGSNDGVILKSRENCSCAAVMAIPGAPDWRRHVERFNRATGTRSQFPQSLCQSRDLLLPYGDLVMVLSTLFRIKRTLDGAEIDKMGV
jgi:hypothetical protein